MPDRVKWFRQAFIRHQLIRQRGSPSSNPHLSLLVCSVKIIEYAMLQCERTNDLTPCVIAVYLFYASEFWSGLLLNRPRMNVEASEVYFLASYLYTC